jgi:aspartyl-tRNA(Asn)/glutamyl-tRNA(Gln) amidotransferase subunit A
MLAAMAGPDGCDPTASPQPVDPTLGGIAGVVGDLSGRRIAAVSGWFTEVCDTDVLRNWRRTLDAMSVAGADIIEAELPSAEHSFTAGWELLYAEAASLHEPHLDRLAEMDHGFVARMLQGRFLLAADYLRAQRLRSLLLDETLAVLDNSDAICTIGVPGTAPRLDDLLVDIDDERLPMQMVHSRATMFGNFTGLPALMMPSGLDRKRMPTAVQLIGRPFAEADLVDLAAALQASTVAGPPTSTPEPGTS